MARIAAALWIAWAVVVWNVVFDHTIVLAGREYVAAASTAAHGRGPYARMDDWMRPAVSRGVWVASAAAGVILLVGFAAIRRATRLDGRPAEVRRHDLDAPAEAGSHDLRGPGEAGAHDRGGATEAGPHDREGETVQSGGLA